MSADLLRRAAKVLREHANGATSWTWSAYVENSPGELDPSVTVEHRWTPTEEDDSGRMHIADLSVDSGGFLYPVSQAKADAAYIALMHPPVALALAKFMDVADEWAFPDSAYASLLTLARAILREAPDGD